MPIHAPSPTPAPRQPVDHNDLSALTKRLLLVSNEITAMSNQLAQARVIREAHGDRTKRLLAGEMRQALRDGDSASKAESMARSSEDYSKGLDLLHDDLRTAETVIAAYDAKRIEWESVRSVLSTLKTTAGQL